MHSRRSQHYTLAVQADGGMARERMRLALAVEVMVVVGVVVGRFGRAEEGVHVAGRGCGCITFFHHPADLGKLPVVACYIRCLAKPHQSNSTPARHHLVRPARAEPAWVSTPCSRSIQYWSARFRSILNSMKSRSTSLSGRSPRHDASQPRRSASACKMITQQALFSSPS